METIRDQSHEFVAGIEFRRHPPTLTRKNSNRFRL